MMFLIFVKRYLKLPLFFLALSSALILGFLYENLDLNEHIKLKVGIVDITDDENSKKLLKLLLDKKSYFQYRHYESVENMVDDVKDEKINYGFLIDLDNDDKIFTLYGAKEKFSEIAKEDLYSEYFKIISENYTKDLLKLSFKDYKNQYGKYIKTTFSFEYEEQDVGKIFPILEIYSFLLFVLSLLVVYDYFYLSSKTKFFETFKGRIAKYSFILSGVVVNSLIYYIVLRFFTDINEINYIIYTFCLYLICLIMINLSDSVYMLIMPFIIILSVIFAFISGVKTGMSVFSFIFINNVYTKSHTDLSYLIFYLSILIIINLLIYICKKYRNNTKL